MCLPSIRPSLPTLYQSSGWSASRKLPLLQRDRETLEYFDKMGAQLAAATNNFGVLSVLLASTDFVDICQINDLIQGVATATGRVMSKLAHARGGWTSPLSPERTVMISWDAPFQW